MSVNKNEPIDYTPDYDEVRAMQFTIKKLAKDLLEIAELAMPVAFFHSDKRCKFARKMLKK